MVPDMKVNAELYVRDLPGQLVASLEPISMVSGNIVGVVHDREQMINDRILVSVTFEVDTQAQLDELKDIWKSMDVQIGQIGNVGKTYIMDYLILGSFDAAYMDDLINGASSAVALVSADVGYTSTGNGKVGKRTAMISAEVANRQDIDTLDDYFTKVCGMDHHILIRGVMQ